VVTPGPRVPAHPGRWLVFRDGAYEEEPKTSATSASDAHARA
jgi:hypothetical protein